MAKMKLVTDDLDALAEAIARRIAHSILDGIAARNDPYRGKCPNCGKAGFIDYCFTCKFVPYWERAVDPD
jgi:hypothetical protein